MYTINISTTTYVHKIYNTLYIDTYVHKNVFMIYIKLEQFIIVYIVNFCFAFFSVDCKTVFDLVFIHLAFIVTDPDSGFPFIFL